AAPGHDAADEGSGGVEGPLSNTGNSSLYLLACAGPETLDRTLLLLGAVVERGGSVVVLTDSPGLALRRTFFGLEVVVRRDAALGAELRRVEALAQSRGAGAVLLDDPRVGDEHAAAVRVLSEQMLVARYGPPLAGGAGGELVIDPYGPDNEGGCLGL